MDTPSTVPEDPRDRLSDLFGGRHWWMEEAMFAKRAEVERLFGCEDALMRALQEHATCEVVVQEGMSEGKVWWRFPKSVLV